MSDATKVEPMDPGKRNSPISVPAEAESTVMLDGASKTCAWNDHEFEDGDQVCDGGTVYECSFGSWVRTGDTC